jgi:hypothetical protein
VTTYTLTVVGPTRNRRGKPPVPAWLNANDRIHWAKRSKLTAEWRQAAYEAFVSSRLPRLDRVLIEATVLVPNARRRDAANWYPTIKACIDGLTDHSEAVKGSKARIQLRGMLPDDDNRHVVGPEMRMRIDRSVQLPTIELTIIDLEAGDHGPA